MSLVGYDASSSDEEPDDSLKRHDACIKAPSSGRGLSTILPKPKGNTSSQISTFGAIASASSKGGIRITAPEIPVLDVDSDDEESSTPAKRKKFEANDGSKPRSGLFAKLPAPVNAFKTGVQSNTSFIPYVFTKPKKDQVSDNTVNLEKTETKAKPVIHKEIKVMEEPSEATAVPSIAEVRKSSSEAAAKLVFLKGARLSGEEEQPKTTVVPSIAEIRRRSAQAAAKLLSSKTAKSSQGEDDSDEEVGSFFSYVEKVPEDEIPEIEPRESQATTFGMNSTELAPKVATPEATSSQYYSPYNIPYANSVPVVPQASGFTMENDSLEMLRLQGKRNRREQINFIDIHQDDALEGGKEMLLKHISEEKGVDRSKIHIPGGMMKKKHQLPYLIQQAKAREVELKNNWAQNRQTKQQTQSKYGW